MRDSQIKTLSLVSACAVVSLAVVAAFAIGLNALRDRSELPAGFPLNKLGDGFEGVEKILLDRIESSPAAVARTGNIQSVKLNFDESVKLTANSDGKKQMVFDAVGAKGKFRFVADLRGDSDMANIRLVLPSGTVLVE